MVTPSDTVILPLGTRFFYVGVTGDVVVDMPDGSTNITIFAAPKGYHNVAVKRIRATGTLGTNLLGCL